MLRLVPRWLCVFAFAVSAFSSVAHAKPFDLIYADRVDVTNTAFTSGFSYGNDIGLIVNGDYPYKTGLALVGVLAFTAAVAMVFAGGAAVAARRRTTGGPS